MSGFIDKIEKSTISRRNFLKTSAVTISALSLTGCSENKLFSVSSAQGTDSDSGKWISAACWHNCGGRCLNKALVVDGVVIRQKTDDTHPDSPEFPQQRACIRGRSQRQQVYGADRLKYPMKRKNWKPGGGKKELRGKDEWERISWEKALDYVAEEIKTTYKDHGPRSVLGRGGSGALTVLAKYGGLVGISDTTSFGTYCLDTTKLGLPNLDTGKANDRFDLKNSETIVLYGCNPAWASGGSPSWHFWQAKKAGAKFVFVGPSYNASASVFEAKWIRVRSGTDTAFLLGVAYTMIVEDNPKSNPLIDWEFLNNYSVGFDADHMPKDAKINENFKDYVLGKYDGQPKTPEWASEICGTPVEDILWYAREMRKDKRVAILHSYAAARNMNAENLPQLFMTIGAMGGHMGKPGHATGSTYHANAANGGPALVNPGSKGLPPVINPITDCINGPNLWTSVLEGKFNSTGNFYGGLFLPKDIQDIDIRLIYHESAARLQASPNLIQGIEAHRKVDFVVSHAQFLKTEAMYSDIVLPVTTPWENVGGGLLTGNREMLLVYSQVTEPLYEAKSDQWIAKELAKRLGINPDELFPIDEKQQFFNEIASSTVVAENLETYEPLVTITAKDISDWGVSGTPQKGRIGLQEFIDKGVYQIERSEGDKYGFVGYEDFVKNPEKNPLPSASGKFEIYCQWKADTLNAFGYGPADFKPYPNYTVPVEGYETTFSDWENKVKGEYPYLVYNPHYLRRSHTVFDNVQWLREAWENPVFLNGSDATGKGIKDGDTVLIWNKYGKILRVACLTEILMPGCVGVPHGSWIDLDEKTGIDRGGADNVLCGPVSSGMGVTGYNNYNCNYKKYDDEPLIPDYKKPQRIVDFV